MKPEPPECKDCHSAEAILRAMIRDEEGEKGDKPGARRAVLAKALGRIRFARGLKDKP